MFQSLKTTNLRSARKVNQVPNLSMKMLAESFTTYILSAWRCSRSPADWPNAGAADYGAASAASLSSTTGTGVFILLLLNLIVYALDHTFHLPQIQRLYLDHIGPKWWQFVTSSFCHASWAHLSSNLFMLYVFGKIVEEEEGLGGVWFTYIITAIGVYAVCF